MAALQQWIANATGRKRLFVEVPDAVGAALASGLGWLPGAPITRDQWLMLQTDTVVTADSDGLAQLGITPTALADVVDGWLVHYRRNARFAAIAARIGTPPAFRSCPARQTALAPTQLPPQHPRPTPPPPPHP